MRLPQTTTGRLLFSVVIISLLLIVIPNIYNPYDVTWGSILSILMISSVALGALGGLIVGGGDWMFRGAIMAIGVFLAAGVLILLLSNVFRIMMN
ncbi:MAG: hypothetical protein R3C03_18065 [Pirellulaceae bacterium]